MKHSAAYVDGTKTQIKYHPGTMDTLDAEDCASVPRECIKTKIKQNKQTKQQTKQTIKTNKQTEKRHSNAEVLKLAIV